MGKAFFAGVIPLSPEVKKSSINIGDGFGGREGI
jgi:hypothetical protein